MSMNPRLLVPRANFDADAAAYIRAVEAADTQALEAGVKRAIDNFVRGCKSDGIWSAIKVCGILAGARTLSGALVPLVGAAPTNTGPFVAGDYDRKTGIKGNGTTKHLMSGFFSGSLTTGFGHIGVFASTALSDSQAYAGANASGGFILRRVSGNLSARVFSGADVSVASSGGSTGFIGTARDGSTNVRIRAAGATSLLGAGSAVGLTSSIEVAVFGFNNNGSIVSRTDARLAFYSLGDNIDLAALDTRVSALITAIGNAI